MKNVTTLLFFVALTSLTSITARSLPAVASQEAQTEIAEITRLEGARANAARNGMGVGQYYATDYVGIAVSGFVPPNSVLLQKGQRQPSLAIRDLTVRVIGTAAITRGVQVGGVPRTAPYDS